MAHITIDMLDGTTIPKRGDLVQTNVGDVRERTWFVLRTRRLVPRKKGVPRAKLWIERWWELEPAFRLRLYRSAIRNGGQRVIHFKRYPSKRKKRLSFEDYMALGRRRSRC